MAGQDYSQDIQASVEEAYRERTPLVIQGGNSKAFYGRSIDAIPLKLDAHHGILNYQATELIITARAGTKLSDIERALDAEQQMLPFEPPHFDPNATLGGTIACGLAGPRRPYSGAVRDFVLGVKIINGKGEILHFGGEVMKNVAGYDVSRLMTGAMGTLGVLLEISLKVLPKPMCEQTLVQSISMEKAQAKIIGLQQQALPLSAAMHDGEQLFLRLSGTPQAVQNARQQIGGDEHPQAEQHWLKLREHQHAFFDSDTPLWRVSVPASAALDSFNGKMLMDWGGAQRWLKTDTAAGAIQDKAAELGGHATLFRGGNRRDEVFQPLSGKLKQLHLNLKLAFDPNLILNPCRMYSDF